MSHVPSTTAASRIDPPDRRLLWGVLVSLLLHGLLLSLQFGIPGRRPGPAGALTVHLMPPHAAPVPQAPIADLPPAPVQASPAPPAPTRLQEPAQAAPRAQPGFTLLDPPRPRPRPTPRPTPRPARRPPRASAVRKGLHTEVIVQDAHKDDRFVVPPVTGEPLPDAQVNAEAPGQAEARQPDAPPAEPAQDAAAAADEAQQQAQRERLAEQREQARAARREPEDAALRTAAAAEAQRAAEQQARLLSQQAARDDDELASRQRQAEQQRLQAEQARAQQLAEQQRLQAEQARAQQLAEQQRLQAEQARAQQLAEQQRLQAEQARAQQLAEQQRLQAEQARAQQLAEQQRIQAEQAEQAERQARQAPLPRPPEGGIAVAEAAHAGAPAGSGLDGVGRGAGALPRGALDSPLATRARELLRGIDIGKPLPQAVRPAEDARSNLRRARADAVQHDVPLRMYIDSIRQKIERNAILSPAQLANDAARIFPIVSIAVRSDGSIEDVTIVRSSGRADIDEVVRRIVHLNARYAAFPPNVAAHYDVIELRRVWSFAGVLRLLEEIR